MSKIERYAMNIISYFSSQKTELEQGTNMKWDCSQDPIDILLHFVVQVTGLQEQALEQEVPAY